jgi:hypothetical protein
LAAWTEEDNILVLKIANRWQQTEDYNIQVLKIANRWQQTEDDNIQVLKIANRWQQTEDYNIQVLKIGNRWRRKGVKTTCRRRCRKVQCKIYREELFLWELPAFGRDITSAADNRLHKELNKVKKGCGMSS